MTDEPRPSRPSVKIAMVVTVGAGLVLARQLGIFDRLAEPARLAQSLVELGAWGWIAFVVAYAVLQPFGVPGTIFVFAAPLIWPWPIAFALSMTGTMAASVIGFSFARFVARDFVSRRIPERFRRYDEALARRAFVTVFVLRLVFWMPQVLHSFFGVSKVRGWTHFWGSLAGYVLPLLLISLFGQRVFEAVLRLPAGAWVAIAGGAATVVATVIVHRRRRARAAY